MKRWLWIPLALLGAVGAVGLFICWHGGAPPATGQAGPVVSVDMNPGTPGIQASRSVVHPAAFCAAIVISGSPSNIGGLDIELAYNQAVIDAPEVVDSGAAVNDNPNLNANSGSPGNPLGTGGCPNETGFVGPSTGWDCSAVGQSYPKGDTDGNHSDGDGTAKIGCFRTGATTGTGNGILAYVTFNTVGGGGPVSLTLQNVSVVDPYAGEIGSCNPVLSLEMPCNNGSITVTGAPAATPVPPTVTPPDGQPLSAAAGLPVAYQQRCSTAQPGRTEVVFVWQPSKAGQQWLDLSLFNNGFAPGTFLGIGPLPRNGWVFVWDGLLPGRTHYLRVNTLTPAGWMPSQTLTFTTAVCGGPAILGGVGQTCGGQAGTVDGSFWWTPAAPAGSVQWLDLSLYNNNFAPGTFLGAGPLNPGVASFGWAGLRSGLVHYWRVNTLTPEGWKPSLTGSFVTGTCG